MRLLLATLWISHSRSLIPFLFNIFDISLTKRWLLGKNRAKEIYTKLTNSYTSRPKFPSMVQKWFGGCSDWVLWFSCSFFSQGIFAHKYLLRKLIIIIRYKVVWHFYICGIEKSRNVIIRRKKKWFLSFYQLRTTALDCNTGMPAWSVAGMTAHAKHHLRHYSTESISQKTRDGVNKWHALVWSDASRSFDLPGLSGSCPHPHQSTLIAPGEPGYFNEGQGESRECRGEDMLFSCLPACLPATRPPLTRGLMCFGGCAMVTVERGREPTEREGFCDGAVMFMAFPPPLSLLRFHPGRQIDQHRRRRTFTFKGLSATLLQGVVQQVRVLVWHRVSDSSRLGLESKVHFGSGISSRRLGHGIGEVCKQDNRVAIVCPKKGGK